MKFEKSVYQKFEKMLIDKLNFLVDKLGINLMSRNYFWDGIMKTTSFSPLFLGYGRGHVKIWMLDNYAPFQNVHCDYIKMFVELGTIGYVLWLYYYLIFLQKKLLKQILFIVRTMFYIMKATLFIR